MEKNREIRVRCPLCNHAKHNFLYEKIGYSIVQCPICSFQYAIDPFMEKKYSEITDSRIGGRLALQNAMTKEALYIWKILDKTHWETMKKKGFFLDIGCNIGVLLSFARKFGWQTKGVEISKKMVEYCKKEKDLDVVDAIYKVKGTYNIITLIDVLEHLLDPKAAIETLTKHLDTDGIMVFSVPITPTGWFINKTHVNYFTHLTLVKFFQILGLEIVHFEFHVNNWGLVIIVRKEK